MQCEVQTRKECNHAASASLQITSGPASCRTSSGSQDTCPTRHLLFTKLYLQHRDGRYNTTIIDTTDTDTSSCSIDTWSPIRYLAHVTYRRLWLFSAPRQLGAYYYISAYIIIVTRPGLLSACALNRMLRLEHVLEVTIGIRNRTLSLLWPKQHQKALLSKRTQQERARHMSNHRSIGFEQSPAQHNFDHEGFLLLVELVQSPLFLESISL